MTFGNAVVLQDPSKVRSHRSPGGSCQMFAFFPATLNCTGQSRQSIGFNQGWVLTGKYNEASERGESGRCVYKSDYREG